MMLPSCPVLNTERLTLRGPAPQDFEPLAKFYADPVRSPGFGGPLKRDEAWRWFALNIGHWCLHGYGFWTVEAKNGEVVGIVGLWNPEGWPEPEIGWDLFDGHEGKGFATEAAQSARSYAYDILGWTTAISLVKPGNDASARVATRLGAAFDGLYEHPRHGTVQIYRHPSPDMLENGGMGAYA